MSAAFDFQPGDRVLAPGGSAGTVVEAVVIGPAPLSPDLLIVQWAEPEKDNCVGRANPADLRLVSADPIRAELCGFNTERIPQSHALESLRGKITLKFALDPNDLPRGVRLGDIWELDWRIVPTGEHEGDPS